MLRSTQHTIEGLKVKSNPEVMKDFFKRIQKITNYKRKDWYINFIKIKNFWGGFGGEWIHVYVWLSPFTVPFYYHSILNWLSVQFSCSVVSNSLQPHGLQHTRLPCPSITPGVYWNSCPLSQWCPPTISFSVIPFSSHPQSFPASGSFPMSQFFTSGGQSTGVSASASVLPMNIRDWFPSGWTGWISL